MADLPNFPDPHVHPQSLDTGSTPKAFAAREVELGTGTLTATDHGTMGAVREVYDLAKKNGLTPILGMEGYLRDDSCPILQAAGVQKRYYDPKGSDSDRKNAALYPQGTYRDYIKYHHLTIHLLNQKAYERASVLLSAADSRAEQHGSERKPLYSWADLEQLGQEDVVMTAGCLIGVAARHLLAHDDPVLAVRYYEKLRSMVKPGNFYVEVFPHDCSHNYQAAVFLTLEGEEAKTRLPLYKTLRVDGQEVKAEVLADRKPKEDGTWGTLQATKHYTKWEAVEPRRILGIQKIEGFIENECRVWQPTSDVQAAVNKFMIGLAHHYGDPILISGDSHYARPENKCAQDVRLAQSGSWRFHGCYHRQSSQEAFDHFQRTLGTSETEFRSWLANNQAWAGRFKDFKFDTPASLPTKFYPQGTLGHLQTLVRKHGRMRWADPVYTDRFLKEIQLYHSNGTLDLLPYFFMCEEIVDVNVKARILTGVGRGSAAGTLLAFLLGITHEDPIKHRLSLERFMTLDRIQSKALPDIDMDFADRSFLLGKDGKPGWMQERFGDHVAQIATTNTLKVRQACQDVVRMVDRNRLPEAEMLTKKFAMPPQGVDDRKFIFGYTAEDGKEVKGALYTDPSIMEFVNRFPKEWGIVTECLSLPKSIGRHPSAYVVANRPIQDFIPTMTVSGHRVTQFTMASVEAMGGVKVDLLRVNSLKDIQNAIELIQARSGVEIPEGGLHVEGRGLVPAYRLVPFGGKLYDLWELPEEDAVFREIVEGKTETVFQLNKASAVDWLTHFRGSRPDGRPAIASVDDLAVFTALDRPGPLDVKVSNPDMPGAKHNMLVEYARRLKGLAKSPDVLPIMEELLPETYAVMCFQEDLQYIYQKLTGCTGSEAEQFRRDVAKKKAEKVQKAFSFFFPRASQLLGETAARRVFETMETWAAYGFCKAHARSYSNIAYVCSWLKHHFPLEWWCGVLKNAKKNEIVEEFWPYCGHLIDLPDLTVAASNFEIRGERIVAPMDLLQGVGEQGHAQLMQYAPYLDLDDLIAKIQDFKVRNQTIVKKKVKSKKTGEEKLVDTVRLGRSALNSGILYRLLIVGIMDPLLPPEIRRGDILTKLEYYEQRVHVVLQTKKVKPVPAWYASVGAVATYVLRKSILPVYVDNLLPVVNELQIPSFHKSGDQFYWSDLPVIGGKQLKIAEKIPRLPPKGLHASALAYISDVDHIRWNDKETGIEKTAPKLSLDIDGESCKVVAWPKKGGRPLLSENVKGCLALVKLSRWKDDKTSFSLEDLLVLQRPVKEPKVKKTKEIDV